MPSLKDLLSNLPDFDYRTGRGNFIADKLDYTNDRENGGKSGQPYIKTKKDFRWSPSNIDDGVLPFGLITNTTRSVADTLRISKFFLDAPKGPLFLAKQVGLQLSNVKLESLSDKVPSKNITTGIKGVIDKVTNEYGNTRIFNPLGINLLAQTGLEFTGEHFNRHGFSLVNNEKDKYEYIVTQNNKTDGSGVVNKPIKNRLVDKFIQLSNPLKNDINIIDEYKGGPGSLYGIGSTTINRYSNSLGNNYEDKNSGFIEMPLDKIFRIHNDLGDSITTLDMDKNNKIVEFNLSQRDFREYKNILLDQGRTNSGTRLASSDYANLNLVNRIGIVKTRLREEREDYSIPGADTSDRVNMLSLFRFNNNLTPDELKGVKDINGNPVIAAADKLGYSNLRDMVKFRIKSIDNDIPSEGVFMVFRAYISSINDKSEKKLTTYNYLGRAENFYVEDGYINTFGVEFMIVANSREEMKPLYQKLNYLKSTLAPDYKATKMRSSMVELTIGDYIFQQPGFITSLNITIDNETNWEIALNEPEKTGVSGSDKRDGDMHELPMMLKVNMSYTPIWNFLPRRSAEARFISINNLEKEGDPKEWLKGNDAKLKSGLAKKK